MRNPRIPICVYPKDISRITGRNVRTSYELMVRIKRHLNKQAHQALSLTELCEYLGLNEEDVGSKLAM